LIAERVAVDAKLIRDAVRRVRAASAERIGDRFRIEFIGAEVAEIFGVDGERNENEETSEQEFYPAPPGGSSA